MEYYKLAKKFMSNNSIHKFESIKDLNGKDQEVMELLEKFRVFIKDKEQSESTIFVVTHEYVNGYDQLPRNIKSFVSYEDALNYVDKITILYNKAYNIYKNWCDYLFAINYDMSPEDRTFAFHIRARYRRYQEAVFKIHELKLVGSKK